MKVTKKEYKKYVDALKKEKAITASKLKWRQQVTKKISQDNSTKKIEILRKGGNI